MKTIVLAVPILAWMVLALTQLLRSFGPHGSRRQVDQHAAQQALARLHTEDKRRRPR